jgi:hypothetical protein
MAGSAIPAGIPRDLARRPPWDRSRGASGHPIAQGRIAARIKRRYAQNRPQRPMSSPFSQKVQKVSRPGQVSKNHHEHPAGLHRADGLTRKFQHSVFRIVLFQLSCLTVSKIPIHSHRNYSSRCKPMRTSTTICRSCARIAFLLMAQYNGNSMDSFRRRASAVLSFRRGQTSDAPLLWIFGHFQYARRLALQLRVQLPCDFKPLAMSCQHPLFIVD